MPTDLGAWLQALGVVECEPHIRAAGHASVEELLAADPSVSALKDIGVMHLRVRKTVYNALQKCKNEGMQAALNQIGTVAVVPVATTSAAAAALTVAAAATAATTHVAAASAPAHLHAPATARSPAPVPTISAVSAPESVAKTTSKAASAPVAPSIRRPADEDDDDDDLPLTARRRRLNTETATAAASYRIPTEARRMSPTEVARNNDTQNGTGEEGLHDNVPAVDRTVAVTGVSSRTTRQALCDVFSRFGNVEACYESRRGQQRVVRFAGLQSAKFAL